MARLPIGKRIRDRRKNRGLTQSALAQAVGISASYLNLIEHDKRPIGGALLARIAKELGVDVSGLSGSGDDQLAHEVTEAVRSRALPASTRMTPFAWWPSSRAGRAPCSPFTASIRAPRKWFWPCPTAWVRIRR